MKKIIFVFFIYFLVSCVEDHEYESRYIVENLSENKIQFELYSGYDTFILLSSDKKEYSLAPRGSFPNSWFPYESIDSIKVTYNDNISIIHGSTLYDVNRSLLLESSFIQTIDDEYLREYKYVFTEDDYIEALDHQ